MKLQLDNISTDESNYLLKKLKEDGFATVNLDPLKLRAACDAIRKNLPTPDPQRINAGYSQGLENVLDEKSLEYFRGIANQICSYDFAKKYLWFPKVAGVDVLWSFFSYEVDTKLLTHAHLWHRDLDDPMGPQIKVMIPLVDTSEENGMFSACSKVVCELQRELQDERITFDRLGTNTYLQSDIVRVTDATMREHFNDKIVDFKTKLGEAILIDTNSCYHKGGLILKPDRERFLVQLTIGSPSHSWIPVTKQVKRFTTIRKKIINLGLKYKDSFDFTKRTKLLLSKKHF